MTDLTKTIQELTNKIERIELHLNWLNDDNVLPKSKIKEVANLLDFAEETVEEYNLPESYDATNTIKDLAISLDELLIKTEAKLSGIKEALEAVEKEVKSESNSRMDVLREIKKWKAAIK